jgi:glycosyltransferase involved in cell wall biosynthesis
VLSLVVPTRGRAASVRRLLLSLTTQAEPPPFEVIVSIDGADEQTHDIVESFAGRLPVRGLSRPHGGRGAACNAGAREAQGRVLVLLDDDMEATSGFLRAHTSAHPAGGRLALVGPAPIDADASAPPLVRYRAAGFERKMERLRAAAEPNVRDMYTGNFSVPRELFLETGGFDQGMVRYGNEDFELLVRLRRAGARLGLAPAAIAVQHYEKDYPQLAQDTLDEGWSAVLFAERHPDLLDEIYLMELRRAPALRRAVLGLGSRLFGAPGFVAAVAALVSWAERRESRHLRRYYDLAFDLHYWRGVESALADRPGAERRSWPEWVREVRARAQAPAPDGPAAQPAATTSR